MSNGSSFDAFHLPGFKAGEYDEIQARNLSIRVPRLTTTDVQEIAARLRLARAHLMQIPIGDIVKSIDAAAQMFASDDSGFRQEALRLLPAATGYSSQMCAYVLDHMVAGWRSDALNELLRSELDDTAILDGFVDDPRTGYRIAARGPDPCLHIFSGNVPGVAVTSLIRALLVRGASLGKTARGEPVLPVLFARALDAVAPALANTIAVTHWPSEQTQLLDAAAAEADIIVVYGGTDAVRAARIAAPPNTRVVVHGPRMSIGFVGHAGLQKTDDARAIAASIALTTATFDQQGCVSPHAVFVQLGASVTPRQLAAMIAEELEKLEHTLPRAALLPEEAAAIRTAKTRAEFASYAGAETEVLPLQDRPFAVIYDARANFEPSCLNRVLYVKTFAELQDIARILRPYRASLQSAALDGFDETDARIAARSLANAGITRITTFERLPFPPATWHHDGSLPLRELLHFIDWD